MNKPHLTGSLGAEKGRLETVKNYILVEIFSCNTDKYNV